MAGYRRAWESADTPAAETFTFTIVVEAGAAPEDAPTGLGDAVVASETDNGSQLRATEGQPFVVTLHENATTGHRWYVVDDGALAAPEREFEAPTSGPVGSGGSVRFAWSTANEVGTHAISLKYSRGEDGEAAETYEVTVDVVAADSDSD